MATPKYTRVGAGAPVPKPDALHVLYVDRIQRDVLRWFALIRVLVMGVHAGTSFLYLLLGVRDQFLALVASSVFIYLCYLFAVLYTAWNFLPRMLERELVDVSKFLHRPETLDDYRAATRSTARSLSRIYYVLDIAVFGFFLSVTFIGPPIVPWMTPDFAPRLYVAPRCPARGLPSGTDRRFRSVRAGTDGCRCRWRR